MLANSAYNSIENIDLDQNELGISLGFYYCAREYLY